MEDNLDLVSKFQLTFKQTEFAAYMAWNYVKKSKKNSEAFHYLFKALEEVFDGSGTVVDPTKFVDTITKKYEKKIYIKTGKPKIFSVATLKKLRANTVSFFQDVYGYTFDNREELYKSI